MAFQKDILAYEEKNQEAEKILVRVKYLILFRLIFATFLLGLTFFFQGRKSHSVLSLPIVYLSLLAGSLFFFTAIFVLYLRHVKNPKLFAYGQLLFDTIFVSLVILFTGGINSIFSFGYIIIIIIAATILSRRGSLIIASASCISYGLILDLQYYGVFRYILPPDINYTSPGPSGNYLYTLVVSSSAFYLVAVLSSHLTRELEKSKTQLKAKQKDLAELEMLNKNIVQSINSGLLTLDNNLRVIYYNRAAGEIIGSEFSKSLLNTSVEQIFPHITSYLPNSEGSSDFIRTRARRGEMEFVRENGERLYLGFSLSLLKGPKGKRYGYILVFQDLTLLKKMEQQVKHMERLALAGEMAAIVAHEIKNPLASISGSIQMLKNQLQLSPLQGKLMGIIYREIERLNNLVNEFSLLTKSRKGTTEIVDVNRIITNTLAILRNNSGAVRRIKIIRENQENLKIKIDPQHFQQLLWNVFTNALDAMPEGGTLTVKTSLIDGNQRKKTLWVSVEISDTGPGIPENIREKIFDPFYTTKTKGTGLGLSIVRRIVDDYGGKINIKNNDGPGTTFKFLFRAV